MGAQLLRGAFSQDIFTGKAKPAPMDKPLIAIKDPEEYKPSPTPSPDPTSDPAFPPNPETALKPSNLPMPTPHTKFEEHQRKVKDIVEMIQRNKNNYYFNMFMTQAKEKNEKNDRHAYLAHNTAHLQPFKYTTLKVPILGEKEGKETKEGMVPLTTSSRFKTEGNSVERKQSTNSNLVSSETKSTKIPASLASLKASSQKRRRKIKSLITQRNEREYYLSFHTSPFEVKLSHLKKLNSAVQNEINSKINVKMKQIMLLKQKQKFLEEGNTQLNERANKVLMKQGMSEKQLRGLIGDQRKAKNEKFKLKTAIKDMERELKQLEHKRITYKAEFERKKMKLKVEESDYREKYQFKYEGELKNPKMKKTLNKKRALLHDTLHSGVLGNNKVTAFETKEGEQYTIDLLRQAEQKDLEEQQKFLQRLIQKEAMEKEQERLRRAAMRKRIASARPFSSKSGVRRERCLSAVMKKQEEAYLQTLKRPYIPPEMQVGLNTMTSTSKLWSQTLTSSKTHKFLPSNPTKTSL